MKNILITGGSGFIGRNLVEGLSERYQVFSPSHRELDLLDLSALRRYIAGNYIDQVIHAAVHVPMVNGMEHELYNDLQMFLNIESIHSEVEQILYFGSGAEFDKRFNIRMVTENDLGRTIPTSDYGLAKYSMNKIAQGSDNIVNLRLFGIFGKYELWQIKFLSNLCCKAVFDLPLSIRKNCYFDFLYIDDLIEIVINMLEVKPIHHDYNVCMGQEYELLTLANMVKDVSNKELDIDLLSEDRNLDYSADNSRLITEYTGIRITSMYEALEKLYKYYSDNRNLIDYNVLKESR